MKPKRSSSSTKRNDYGLWTEETKTKRKDIAKACPVRSFHFFFIFLALFCLLLLPVLYRFDVYCEHKGVVLAQCFLDNNNRCSSLYVACISSAQTELGGFGPLHTCIPLKQNEAFLFWLTFFEKLILKTAQLLLVLVQVHGHVADNSLASLWLCALQISLKSAIMHTTEEKSDFLLFILLVNHRETHIVAMRATVR